MDASRTPDVVVVGAGPAGSAAAITLARLGRRVTMVDKAVFPRDKCCGDGLTTAALRRLEHLGLDPARVASWQPITEAVVVATDGREVQLPLRGGKRPPQCTPEGAGPAQFAASARRRDLDAALLEVAQEAGATVLAGAGAVAVTPTPMPTAGPAPARGAPAGGAPGVAVDLGGAPGVVVDLDDGRRLHARYVLAADGMWSPVRRALGLSEPGYLGEWQAGRRYYAGVGPAARKLWVWFEPDMVPGYAWSFPLPDGTANVGYGVRRGMSPPPLRGQSIDLIARTPIAEVLGPRARPSGPWRAWPIPARIGSATLEALGGRVLFAGDAAGACDPMTGEGIAQALETGELAARAVAQAGPDRPAAAASRYRRQVRWGLAADDGLARVLSAALARPGGSAAALAAVDNSAWFRRNFARWMFEDYPRAALVTPHRWRRRLFTGPGAYAGPPAGREPARLA